jgi:two-component system chemotaxis response regulator CheB
VIIACSTGGPRALAEVLPALPAPLGAGTIVVQHMPPGFTALLAKRLDPACALGIREAQAGDRLDPRTALVAPGGSHLRFNAAGRLSLSDEPEIGGLRPRADLTIEDAARVHGRNVVLAVLTGMGEDALVGARAVRAAGGTIIGEAEETCTIYGMPRAVAEAGLTDAVVPLDRMAATIAELADARMEAAA